MLGRVVLAVIAKGGLFWLFLAGKSGPRFEWLFKKRPEYQKVRVYTTF